MIADPKCERCARAMVWIGIGPGAEAVCPAECVPGPACPSCGSRATEPFRIEPVFYYFMLNDSEASDGWHCLPCGNVWEDS